MIYKWSVDNQKGYSDSLSQAVLDAEALTLDSQRVTIFMGLFAADNIFQNLGRVTSYVYKKDLSG